MGFFSQAEIASKPPPSTIPSCGRCGLHKKCQSPKMPVTGDGGRGVLMVAEAPGQQEDDDGVQLVGKAGKRLRLEMDDLGWDLDADCWKTNSVICRPPDNEMEDLYIEACRPNLNKTIAKLQPEAIVLLGGSAVKSLIGQDWKRDIGPLERWVGWTIPSRRLNSWICPTYHPSFLERKNNEVIDLWFRRHLARAFKKEGRPWGDSVPDIKDNLLVELSPSSAAKFIRDKMKRRLVTAPVAFDYETNMLKPESDKARIYSCAISFGDVSIAYPWDGDAIEATREVLRSPIPKIGANIKFEQNWTRATFGRGVKKWLWDCMQAAHVLDNRRGITSVKFQAFVRLGIEPWDENIHQFLMAKGGNTVNRIKEIPLRDLLFYNAIDSQVEYELALLQMEDMGVCPT